MRRTVGMGFGVGLGLLALVLFESGSVTKAQPQADPRDGKRVRQPDSLESMYAAVGDEEEGEIARLLERKVSFAFDETPLVEVIRALESKTEVSFVIVRAGLEIAHVEENTPITIEADHVSLRLALDLVLRPLTLDYIIRDGVLIVQDRQTHEDDLFTLIYPVPDLVTVRTDSELTVDVDPLIEAIQSIVQPYSWEEKGGEGFIDFSPAAMSLVIRTTRILHEGIKKGFKDLRKARDRSTAIAEAAGLPTLPRMQAVYYLAEQVKIERETLEELTPESTSDVSGDDPRQDENRAIAIAIEARRIAQKALGIALEVERKAPGLEESRR